MKRSPIKLVVVFAMLLVPVRLRLHAQDQQKQGQPANATATANYNFLIASGFLCDPNDSTACPAVAKADSGETIEISGAGTLDLAGKSVAAAGASPAGDIRRHSRRGRMSPLTGLDVI
jgi:hypothetical protein